MVGFGFAVQIQLINGPPPPPTVTLNFQNFLNEQKMCEKRMIHNQIE